MKFRVLSDIHLEFYRTIEQVMSYIQWTDQDIESILILAGDIGYPLDKQRNPSSIFVDFLSEMKQRFREVILITGNHEYYIRKPLKLSMDKIDTKIREICDSLGVHFLQKDSVTIEDVTIYGCTMFTDLKLIHAKQMNDIKKVESFTNLNKIHRGHVEWLESQQFEGKTIVVTHHVPMLLENKHTGYYSDVLPKLDDGEINYWICGHTHDNINIRHNNTTLLSCCIGYPEELEQQGPLYFCL